MDTGLVQILVAIIGAFTPIIIKLIEQKQTQTPDKTPKSQKSRTFSIKSDRSRSFLDLSIILLYAAFFSAILADSLLVSGRLPTLGIVVILQILFITLCITVVLASAWYWGRGELAVGILSLTTLIVLILSPGGPFNPTTGEKEVGLSLLLPVFVLVLLSTSSATYLFGNPLARNTLPKTRRKVILFLSLLLCIGALTLGTQFVSNVSKDSRTPQFKGNPNEIHLAEKVISKIRTKSVSLRERGLFYKLGSEIALSKYYLDSYFQVLSSLDFSNIGQYVNPNNSSTSPDKTVKKKFDKNTPQKIQVLKSLAKLFSSNSTLLQLSYLSDRLKWVHPTVLDSNAQLNLALPGITAKERFEALTNYRIFHSMSGQQNLLERFFDLFEYDGEIVEAFDYLRPKESNKSEFIPQYGEPKESRFDNITRQTWASLFPNLPPQVYTDLLRQQLAFPESDELFVAYSTYGHLAPFYENKSIQEAKALFDDLKPETQRAFITYLTNKDGKLDNYKIFANLAQRVVETNESIPNLDNSPSAAIEIATLIKPNNNTSTINASTDEIQQLADLIKNIIFPKDADSKDKIAILLQKEIPQIPIRNILNDETLKFVTDIHSKLPDKDKNTLFSLLRDPVTPTIQKMAESLSPYKKETWLKEQLNNFIKLRSENQEAILHNLAIATYKAEGEHSLRPIQLLIFQAYSLNYWLAFLCSTILFLPIVASAIFTGGFLGRKLVERDRIRDLIITEKSNQQEFGTTHAIGIPVELQGREKFLEKLRNLSGRGWSTIGVVGRRGIGKSRILHELYQPSSESSQDYGISVWISAPSQYEEEDFIETVLEQFALNTEKAVARYLGAEPFAVRQLEALLAKSGLLTFVIAICILASMWLIIYQRLLRPEVVISWFPILLVVVVSTIFLVRHFANLQPLDLSPWLESDRTHSPHTVLLYRRVQKALRLLKTRNTVINTQLIPIAGGGIIITAAWAIIVTCVIFIILIISSFITSYYSYSLRGSGSGASSFLLLIVLFFLCSTIFFFITRKKRRFGHRASLMSLIAEYRNFAETVVYRLERGALGSKATNLMICIDELDKIIELQEVRDFLRRMKGIFEVPGVYYYLSLSEDALAALYLGSAEGKNEVDSSLDHIVRIPPLSWEEAQKVATTYLSRRQVQQFDPKIVDALVATSFGVPRDILRRFDELWARKDFYNTNPQQLVYEFRKDQIEIASQTYEWPKRQYEAMLEEAVQSAQDAKYIIEELKKKTSKLRESRVLILIWILCCIEYSNRLEDKKRIDFLKILYEMGYSLAIRPLSDLIDEMDNLSANFILNT